MNKIQFLDISDKAGTKVEVPSSGWFNAVVFNASAT